MANQRHVDILLHDGVESWNLWRKEEPEIAPDLSGADLSGVNMSWVNLAKATLTRVNLSEAKLKAADLREANLYAANLLEAELNEAHLYKADLHEAYLHKADLNEADLGGVNLSWANLSWANLSWANLGRANLTGAILTRAKLSKARFNGAHLSEADLSGANLSGASLSWAILNGARMRGADLSGADLTNANLSEANLSEANLSGVICVRTNLSLANLSRCTIYGISVWDAQLEGAIQRDLRITPPVGESAITVDNLEVAQFLYLLLHNERARAVLDTITSKVVLILGRFGEHKAYLDAVREALRSHPNGYIPILFDFDPQADKPILETVKILANLARFVIADLTDPRMVRAELTAIIPNVPTVPVQPIAEGDAELPTEYDSWALYRSFLPVYRYADLDDLLVHLTSSVIEPAEGHVQARRLSNVSGSQA